MCDLVAEVESVHTHSRPWLTRVCLLSSSTLIYLYFSILRVIPVSQIPVLSAPPIYQDCRFVYMRGVNLMLGSLLVVFHTFCQCY
ncbi:hypothetical protein BDV38DRAFT_257306 [Aspergillus pseudotamarii]|uniref:Uncharacterized protein n=1 Tax=Aspergillus pseudotamarii TaxID=132259 RepID=A0A5N6SKR3_ASPPS|nr:uncharacterized protein BDV38DRAFT_257306 [Aspergillus pseudotamarii]KAE8133724.1 hypothetical protein BDV38DRAFT_257306 [Aspergillus pseudotamarii]